MFPIRDENRTESTPVATIALIALNVLSWVFLQGLGSDPTLSRSVCELGLVPDERWRQFEARRDWLATEPARLQDIVVRPADVPVGGVFAEPLAREASAYALLRRPGVEYRDVAALERVGVSPALAALDAELVEQWTGS